MAQPIDVEAGLAQQPVDRPVEVAAAGETAPQRVKAVLPARDIRLGRPAVLDRSW
jgi:hypothetical protein